MVGRGATTETITPITPGGGTTEHQKTCERLDSCPANVNRIEEVLNCATKEAESESVCARSTIPTQIDNMDYYEVTKYESCKVCKPGYKRQQDTNFCSNFTSFGPGTCKECEESDCTGDWRLIDFDNESGLTVSCLPFKSWSDYSDTIERQAISAEEIYGPWLYGNENTPDNQCCIKCSYTYKYRCKAGYYDANGAGTADLEDNLDCQKCPSLNNNANVNITSTAGSDSLSDCYIVGKEGNTITDSIGTFYFENDCNHP